MSSHCGAGSVPGKVAAIGRAGTAPVTGDARLAGSRLGERLPPSFCDRRLVTGSVTTLRPLPALPHYAAGVPVTGEGRKGRDGQTDWAWGGLDHSRVYRVDADPITLAGELERGRFGE
jgi:hypothetical protein